MKTIDIDKEYGDNWKEYCQGCRLLSKEYGAYFCEYDWQCPYLNRNDNQYGDFYE